MIASGRSRQPSNCHGCYCGWLDGREHYGTVGYVDEHGTVWHKGARRGE